ncbi:unnamed protein product [Hydatigera taeniaeformis]|uniref:Uncharacterized protein n=1 Tax=Hydatigena taeniaeformis TaxID=6205 RepID=A0A0R3XBZ2_HYDTA|nr:unnamed protein product [Hydatigera taeniaeformis]
MQYGAILFVSQIEQTIFEAKVDKLKSLKLAHKLSNDYCELLADVNNVRSNLGLLSLEDGRCPEALALVQPLTATPLQLSASGGPGCPPISECLESLPVSSAINQDHVAVWLSTFRRDDLSWAKQFATEIGDLNSIPLNLFKQNWRHGADNKQVASVSLFDSPIP